MGMGPVILSRPSPTRLSGHIQISPRLTVTGGTFADDTNRPFNLTATFPSVITATRSAVNFIVTGAGSSAQEQQAFRVDFQAGYTGTAITRSGHFINAMAAGTAIGVSGAATGAATIATGVYGDASTGANNWGGFFGTGITPAGITGTAALACSNGAASTDAFRAYDNTSLVVRIRDGGAVNLAAIGNGSPSAGDLWRDNTQLALTAQVGGMTQRCQTITATTSAAATVANTTTETTLFGTLVGSKTFAASSFFAIGKTVEVEAWGHFSTTGTPTIRFRLKLGSTAVLDTTAITTPSGVTNMWWHFKGTLTCRTTGASGTVIAQGVVYYGAAGTLLHMPIVSTGTTTIDTTAAQVLDLTVEWGTASASNTISCHNAKVAALN